MIRVTGKDTFPRRHAVHRALLHAKENNRALPADKTMHHILDIAITQDDFADLSIDFIRRWKMWSYSSRIISLYKTSGSQLVKRSIVRLALQSPDPLCKAFITQLRKDMPELVNDCEEIVELEKEGEKKNPRR